jgi:hypothetical protein
MTPRIVQFRSLLTLAFLFFATTTCSCAQENPKRMVPGPSVKELVPESPNEKEDGISRIIFAQLFKPGETEYSHVGTDALKNAPPLPTGYTLYKDRIYEVKTQAIITSAFNITVFKLPSVENERQFKNLAVLHLKHDEMSPTDNSWEEATLPSEAQDDFIFHFIPKPKYDSLQEDFKSRQLAAVTEQFGLFLIALAPESAPVQKESFPEVVMKATSLPESVRPAQEVTHRLEFTNKGTSVAAEINVKEVLDIDLEYVSATPTPLPAGGAATVMLVSRARDLFLKNASGKIDSSKTVNNSLEVVFKQAATDFVDERGQIFNQVTTTIVREP